VCGNLQSAQAVQWQSLKGTERYKVAYDEHSIRMNHQGRFEVWLRFLPRKKTMRVSAAAKYKDKRYQSHLELHEIDCSEQTARMGLTYVLGKSRVRLKQLHFTSPLAPILPGSLLEDAAQRICPVMDEESESEVQGDPKPVTPETPPPSSDQLQQIERLIIIAASKEATVETWKELGNLFFDTNQPELAIKAYDKALALRPDDIDILIDQGAMYRQTGNFIKALANFERASSADSQNLESLYNSAHIYAFDLNDIPKALVIWKRYLALESKSEAAQQVQSFIDLYGKHKK
jgi:tetratricopeptide (TPR) repeat protein